MSIIRAARVLVAAGLMTAAFSSPVAAQSADAYYEFLMARRMEARGDHAGALAALERAAAANPASAEVRAEIASFHLRRNQRDEAEKAAREALVINDDNVEAHRVLGLLYAASADSGGNRGSQAEAVRNAIEHLEQALGDTTRPTDLNLQFTLGRLHMRAGNSAEAIEALTRVVAQNPDSVQGRLMLAQAYAAAEDLANAISTLDLIVADEPRVASTLAQYQEQAGQLDEAAANYTRALALQPMSRELKFRRAATMFNAGNYEQAIAYATQAQTQHPNDLRFLWLRARALSKNGNPEEALRLVEPAATAAPRDTSTQFALADLYTDAGRDEDAERIIRQLLDIDPANPDALNYLGYLLADNGRQLEEAVKLVERALNADPGNPNYLDSLGWAYFRLGELEAAERYLAPAAERMPRNSVVQEHFGDVLAGRGRLADAIEAWMRALDGASADVDRDVIRKKIDEARARLNR